MNLKTRIEMDRVSRRNSLNFSFENKNLRITNKKIKKFDISSFDCETVTNKNDFYLFGYTDDKGEYISLFDKLESIHKLIRIKHRGILIFATNLGFDFNVLCDGTDLRSKCDILIRGNNFITIKFRGTYNTIILLDSVNFGGLSVETMGKILGKPKGKKPRCLGRHPKNKKELVELLEYNKRDCEITREFMLLFQEVVNNLGGELKNTISSTAMFLFRKKFLKYDVISEDDILGFSVKDKIFSGYYGGRTECFKRGLVNKKIFCGDVNSLYPSVMLNEFPDPLSVNYCQIQNIKLLKYMGVSYFELMIPYSKYPFLPLKFDGKLIFPYGLLKGYYTHEEINYQLRYQPDTKIIKMNDTVYYTGSHKFFKEYVETLYNLRFKYKSEKNPMETVCKLLLNSLYGRFALKNIEKTTFFSMDDYEESLKIILKAEAEGKRISCNSVNEAYVVEKEEYTGVTSYPIWSVYVTAYARVVLHKLILKHNPYYVDTDSVYTDDVIEDKKELGALKIEKILYQCIFIKPKLYFADNEIKAKGLPIPKTQREIMRLKQKILGGRDVNYNKFVKTKEGIKRNIKVNSILLTSKTIDLEDSKRIWENPFSVLELQDSEPIEIKGSDY